MTTPSIAQAPKTEQSAAGGRFALPAFLPARPLAAFAMAAGMVVAVELTGRSVGLEPAMLLPLVVGASAFIGGLTAAFVAGGVGGAYTVLYYSQPAWAGNAAGMGHSVATITAAALAAWLVLRLRDRIDAYRASEVAQANFVERVIALTDRLAHEPFDSMPDLLAMSAASLLDADMAVLTILDPPTGRHFVRAVYGSSGSALGVEVLPGVGITGQAIRQRQVILAGTAAALPALQAGRVIATITFGRNERKHPFGEGERRLLEGILPVVTLAAAGTLARREGDEGTPRDGMTGLFNHAYLDAALDQLLALRRRAAPEERVPLAMLMFDVDSFRSVNERYSRQVGDNVLRAVATLIRQRFRASDIVARVGPDSFFVVLNGATPEIASEAAAQIRRQVRELNMFGMRGEPVVVSISAGVAMYRDGDQAEALFKSVEAALETARWSGQSAVVSI
ncbi:MAG TPA: sensor domain-containing diguanylate cyclase [Candidatus Limnocylindria bacterium]|nr:sensor domain-containing diguanylate cyclase [Candidatus Limnocylindria bacterium]